MTQFFHDCNQSKKCLLIFLLALLYGSLPQLKAQNCDPDNTPPACVAPADVTVLCSDFDPTLALYGMDASTDNCCMDTVIVVVNNNQFSSNCMTGTIVRTFKAFDCSGNSSLCTQSIVVTYAQDYYLKFPNDVVTTGFNNTGYYGEPTFFGMDCELLGTSYNDRVFTNDPDATYRLERTWTIINWCTYDPSLPLITVPNPTPTTPSNNPNNLPGPTVSPVQTIGDPWKSTIVKIAPTDPTPTNYSTFWDANANGYQYTQTIKILDTFYVAVQGVVFADSIANCNYDSGESPLANWSVKATGSVTGQVKIAQTGTDGVYSFLMSGLDTLVNITLVSSGNFGQNCQTSYNVPCVVGQISPQNFPVHLEQRCKLLSVNIGTVRLRRCFDNRYVVQACNLSDEAVQNAYVDVDLDGYLDYLNASIPGTLQSGNKYRFQLGDLPAGECQNFTIDVKVNCAAPLGYTHCTQVSIKPYDDCRESSGWSGAEVTVTAACDGDSVRLKISNTGTAPMAQTLDFVVVEDIIMRQSGGFQLDNGASLDLAYGADGSTWRLEAQQEPLHPFGGSEAVALEGCGGLNTPGLVNLFPLGDNNPFTALDCQQNIGSIDPNDKQAFPVGFGPEHFLEANTDIEYMIRFQNTGSDTAFTVVVLDTLSPYLNPASVRVGAASHNMEFALLEGGVLKFSFPNIELPDSNINAVGSNGFLKFRVSQKKDNADGSLIKNRAAIYFDFNDAVITNTTFHTIGHPSLSVGIDDPFKSGKGVQVFPNPTADVATFKFENAINQGFFELKNQVGQVIRSERFTGIEYRFEGAGLQPGVYFFSIMQENGTRYSGKILMR